MQITGARRLGVSAFVILALFSAIGLGLLEDDFKNPPREYRAKFRYWLPDASVPSEVVSKDIQDLANAGAGGLELLPFYLYGLGNRVAEKIKPPTDWTKYGFGTPAFVSLFKNSLKSVKEARILMDFALGPNQGQGVPSKVLTPGLAVQILMGNATISAGKKFSGRVPPARQPSDSVLTGMGFMNKLEQFGTPNLTAVIAYQVATVSRPVKGHTYLNQSSFIDLTNSIKNGVLDWTPPDNTSTWQILSFWEAYTNQRASRTSDGARDFLGNGSWTVDHFSKAGAARVTDFWDQYILSDPEVGQLVKEVGKYAWEDSMEIVAALYWTPSFANRFQATNNYSILPYLPLLFNGMNGWGHDLVPYPAGGGDGRYEFTSEAALQTDGYQLDYRNILNDGYKDYNIHLRDWAHSRGFEYSTQPAYNLPLDMLSDVPLIDAPEGESLGFSNNVDIYRQFVGPVHLYNKKVISTELGAVQTPPYSLTVNSLLSQVKQSLAAGFTMHVLHGFTYSGPYPNTTWPGYTTFYYEFTEMWNSIQPAWIQIKDSLDYIARNQFILQQGVPQVDLAFYLFSAPWNAKPIYSASNLQNLGFTYDYLSPDNLVGPEAYVKENTLGVPAYKALIIYLSNTITVHAASKLLEHAESGLPIIVLGSIPNNTFPATQATRNSLQRIVSRLAAHRNVHHSPKGTDADLPGILSSLGITPRTALDCKRPGSGAVSELNARRYDSATQRTYIYFYHNSAARDDCIVKIPISSPVIPFVYNAWTGVQSPLLNFTISNNTLSFKLNLEYDETMILALNPATNVTPPVPQLCSSPNRTSTNLPPTILTNWDLVVSDWHSAPDLLAIKTEVTNHTYKNITLRAWTDIDPSLSTVSGIGTYTTRFTVPKSNASAPFRASLSLPFPTTTLPQHNPRVKIDGVRVPPIDPVNPVVEISEYVKGKEGEEVGVEIEIATTLWNRVKSEVQKGRVRVAGFRADELAKGYASGKVEKYGLVGDVKVEWKFGC